MTEYLYNVQFVLDYCVISTTVTTDIEDEELALSIAMDNIHSETGYKPNTRNIEVELIEEMEYGY